jgi:hypothetical protein
MPHQSVHPLYQQQQHQTQSEKQHHLHAQPLPLSQPQLAYQVQNRPLPQYEPQHHSQLPQQGQQYQQHHQRQPQLQQPLRQTHHPLAGYSFAYSAEVHTDQGKGQDRGNVHQLYNSRHINASPSTATNGIDQHQQRQHQLQHQLARAPGGVYEGTPSLQPFSGHAPPSQPQVSQQKLQPSFAPQSEGLPSVATLLDASRPIPR